MAITKKVRLKEITETEILDATVIAITMTKIGETAATLAAIGVTTAIKQPTTKPNHSNTQNLPNKTTLINIQNLPNKTKQTKSIYQTK